MAPHPLTTTEPSDWSYAAEGGANLVLSYAGPSSSLLTGKAIRLRKRKIGPAVDGPAGEVDIRFAQEVVLPLLGVEHVVRMERVDVEPAFLQGIKDALEERLARPIGRRELDEVDVAAECVVLTDDLVHGEGVLAIEIKPKWGFLPRPDHLQPFSRSLKTRHCRFCMHSCLKASKRALDEGSIPFRKAYCPLDLYSHDAARVEGALVALWDGWIASDGQANNLRLFLNGKQISSSESDLRALADHLDNSPSISVPPHPSSIAQLLPGLVVDALLPILLSSPLLEKLSSLQRSLDPLDVEGLATQLSRSPSHSLATFASSPNPTVDEWIAWAAAWASSDLVPSRREPRLLVLAYLLSATFKDCSVFVRISKDDRSEGVKAEVKAIDLDPKPIARLVKYHELDAEIVSGFGRMKERCECDGIPVEECYV